MNADVFEEAGLRADPDPHFTGALTRWLVAFTFVSIATVAVFIPLAPCPSCEDRMPQPGLGPRPDVCTFCRGRGRLNLLDRWALARITVVR